MVFSTSGESGSQTKSMGPVYSFRAQAMPLVDALALFARVHKLNIVAGPDIQGEITVDFHDLSLDRALAAILEAHGYYWKHEKGLIQVRRLETRVFHLDYIRLVRGGSSRNKAQITSGSGGSGPQGATSSHDAGEITVNQKVQIKFWEELETQVETLMSEEGRLVSLSGTIQVTDRRSRMKEIGHFLFKVRRSLYRQVEIQARIYEVNLKDEYSLGIDWTKINFLGAAGDIAIANIITAPFGGFVATAATTAISFQDGSFDVVLEALREQGEIQVVSQPRVVTLNNQPALIKVATDQAFFTQTIAQGAAGTGNIITEQVRSVTVGLVLSVTPQVSEDGWVMLDVTPIISRLRGIIESPQKTATAPVLDVKQSSGLVRLRDGEMVLIGGLIQDEYSETERKVPLLGDIPWLGRLFKGTYTAKQKSELVIFLSPRILDLTQ
jgi:MSHA type pilus biogenesis protein MshL